MNIVESFWKLSDLLKNNKWFQGASMVNVDGTDLFYVYTSAKEKQFDSFEFDGIKVIEFLVPKGAMKNN